MADRSIEERWQAGGLSADHNGRPHANLHNCVMILRNDPVFKKRYFFDEFHHRIRVDSAPRARDITDADEIECLHVIQGVMGIPKMSLDSVHQAIIRVADGDRRSEPRDWMKSLTWDGRQRLGLVMSRGFGTADSDYSMKLGENLFKSMAVRVREPGAKCDWSVVLEGPQGIFKSSGLEVVGGPWFGALHSSFTEKDAVLELSGKLLVEVAELHSISNQAAERVKQFQSRRTDRIRPPYGRHAVDFQRQCIFAMTTNEAHYLSDSTGARRYFPARCGTIDLDWLRDNREQLFAEAWCRVEQGEDWWRFPEREALVEQEMRYEGDPWEEPVERYVALQKVVTVTEVLREACKVDVSRHGKADQMRVAAVLRRLGWDKDHAGPAASRRRCWVKSELPGGAEAGKVVQLKTSPEQPGALPVPPITKNG